MSSKFAKKHPYLTQEALKDYDKTHFVPTKTKVEIANFILKKISFSNKKEIYILDAGVGRGNNFFLTLIEQLILNEYKISKLVLTVFDNSRYQLTEFESNLKKQFRNCLKINATTYIWKESNLEIELCQLEMDLDKEIDFFNSNKGKFDLIISTYLLHHLLNWRIGVIKLLYTLKENGLFILAERIDHNRLLDGKIYSSFDSNNNTDFENILIDYIKLKQNYFYWDPEISSSDIKNGVNFVSPFFEGKCAKTFKYRQEVEHSELKKWIKNGVFSFFWSGPRIPDDKIERIFGKNNSDKKYTYHDGQRIIILENFKSFYPSQLMYWMTRPIIEKTVNLLNGPKELHNAFIHLLATNGFFFNSTKFISLHPWDIIRNEWAEPIQVQINIDFFHNSEEVYVFARNYIYYLIFSQEINFSFNKLIFLDLKNKKRLKICLYAGDSLEIEEFDAETISIKVPIKYKNIITVSENSVDGFEDSFISKCANLRSNITNFKINKELVNKYNKVLFKYDENYKFYLESIKNTLEDSKVIKNEIILDENYQTTLDGISKIIMALVSFFLSDSSEEVVYEPSKVLKDINKNIAIGFGGLIKFEKISKEYSETEIGKFSLNLIQQRNFLLYQLVNIIFSKIGAISWAEKARIDALEQSLKTAIISILVDSFAHNVSAHSLAALEWWIRSRSKMLEQRAFIPSNLQNRESYLAELEPIILSKEKLQTIAKNAEKYYEFTGFEDSTYNKDFFSLFDLIQYMGEKLQKRFLLYNRSDVLISPDLSSPKYQPQFPVPLDYALWQFIKFMRDKAAFWSGVTRDVAFGGEIKNLYDLLWNDFANNPLFLGTIARSEEISKLNINLRIFDDDHNIIQDGLFAQIDLSVIDWENDLFKIKKQQLVDNLNESILPVDVEVSNEQDFNIQYSKYAFVRITKKHKALREELSQYKYNVFLPGGVVGKHSFFTLIENTIRNVKHYKNCDDWNEIKKRGLDLYISIAPIWLQNNAKAGKKRELYKIGTWINHDLELYIEKADQQDERIVPQKIRKLLQQPIIDSNGKPRLGGNSQDKICAAMLLNNTFSSVENMESARDKFYNSNGIAWIDILSEPASITRGSKGMIKKYFHLWQGDFVFVLKDLRDLDDENISRFKIVYVPIDNSEIEPLISKARENGVLRILSRKDLEKGIQSIKRDKSKKLRMIDIEQKILSGTVQETDEYGKDTLEGIILYYSWLRKFLYGRPVRILKGHNFTGKSIENFLFTNSDSFTQTPIDLKFAHGTNLDPATTLDFRSHGSLMEHFCQNDQDFKAQFVYLSEFIETVLLRICLFDDRLADRIPDEKLDLYYQKLGMKFVNERRELTKQDNDLLRWSWETEKANLKSEYNVLIIHLSFIESLEYSETRINEFIEKELAILPGDHISKFVLVITTGRGREQWHENLFPEYKKFTIFRPIESLLTAVEDAVSLKDDFQVKYNLTKVIFGS